jgi:hypothetical protein
MRAHGRLGGTILASTALAFLLAGAGTARADILYSVDDGTAERPTGLSLPGPGGSVVFVNRFTAVPGGEVLTSISVAYGSPPVPGFALPGTPVEVILFRDQNGGATPDHPVLLASAPTSVTNHDTNTFIQVPITSTAVTGNFFVGVLVSNLPAQGLFPIGFDTDNPQRASFGAWFSSPINLSLVDTLGFDPSVTADQNLRLNSGDFVAVIDGNYLIRATGVPAAAEPGLPEPSTLALLALGGVALAGWRRWRRGDRRASDPQAQGAAEA